MRPILLIAFTILLAFSSKSQQNNDTAMIALARSAFAMSVQHPDSGMVLSSKALQQYHRSGNKLLGGFACKARGWSWLHLGNYDSAFLDLQRSAALFSAAHDTLELMFVYLNLANAYVLNSQFAKSAAYVVRADTLADGSNNLKAKAMVKNQMAILFREQHQYPKAIGYFKEAIETYVQLKDSINYLGAIGSLSILYNAIAQPDSSLAWLNKCFPIIQSLKGYEYEKAMIYERTGDTRDKLHQYDKAMDSYRHAYDLFRATGNKADQAYEATNLGKTLTNLHDPKQAEYYLLQSYRLNDSLHLTNYAHDAASNLAALYTTTNDWHKAYQWMVTTRALQDTLDKAGQIEKTAELQAKYEAEKKDKEIALLKKDQELRAADLQKERTIKFSAFILSALVILIGFLVLNRYRLIQKTRRLVEIEKLRNTIARDLHDDIGSALSSIHINSNMALSHPEQQVVKSQLENIQKNSGRMMESMGDIVWAINPANDSMENLQSRMKEFLAEILEPLNISWQLNGTETLKKIKFDIDKRKEMYLIFKEAVNNAAKYSACTNITVRLQEGTKEAILQITDNGRGFDMQNVRQGNGLHNMQQRAALMEGVLDISSTPDKGTTVTLQMPLT
jgi:two-component system sensor histidine kinase UhpB